ncbi:MFS transporter [Paenibacillus sp. KACC 21273]|uniref:MFS transporter n=1 Tax=Paenibacillus sp. KACC 21273 TaxID=3025665 RepID=UPI002365B97D|nr:MFS transporter [Paenibacillus sp. KACC 21273]WDF49101.1 MFS transporter [Paenibacillus sp. KACC 21273]
MRVLLSIWNEIRSWPHNVRLFFWANLFYQIGTGMFSVLYNLYIQGLGYPDVMNGRIISIQSLATAILFIPVGLMGDRFSRKKLLVLGALASGLFFVGRSFAIGEQSLLLLAICSGIFASIFQVMAIPFLAENVAKSKRLRMFSYLACLTLAAQVLGNTGGGVLADLLQFTGLTYVLSLQLVLLLGSIATLASFIPMAMIREHPVSAVSSAPSVNTIENKQTEQSTPATVITSSPSAPSTTHSDTVFISRFLLAQLLTGLGSGLVVPYLNLYFTNRFAVSLTSMSILISLGQLMTIVSMLLGPSLAARIGAVRAVVVFQLLSLPFLLLTGFTNVLIIASVSFLFRQALMNAANPLQSSIMVDRVSDKRRSIANSLMQTVFMLGWASMGPVQSYLVTSYGTYWGYAIAFSITGVLYTISSLLYYFMFRKPTNNQVQAIPSS